MGQALQGSAMSFLSLVRRRPRFHRSDSDLVPSTMILHFMRPRVEECQYIPWQAWTRYFYWRTLIATMLAEITTNEHFKPFSRFILARVGIASTSAWKQDHVSVKEKRLVSRPYRPWTCSLPHLSIEFLPLYIYLELRLGHPFSQTAWYRIGSKILC